jgi:hypothetical protein
MPTHQQPENQPWNFADTGAVIMEVDQNGNLVKKYTFPTGWAIFRIQPLTYSSQLNQTTTSNPTTSTLKTSPTSLPSPTLKETPQTTPTGSSTPQFTNSITTPTNTSMPTGYSLNWTIFNLGIIMIALVVVSIFVLGKTQETDN